MNYNKSLHYLDSFLNLEKLSEFPQNAFFNLARMEHLLRISGYPEKAFLPVLIAGTTGKGSTGFFLESILAANEVPVGYYHSPHVEDVRERIRVGGRMASRKLWADGLSMIKRLLQKHPLPSKLGALTYFEVLTFLAVLIFAKTKKRVGIFEVGLGGRLDATNVLKAPLVILTPIHLDHEHFLGNTVAKIAREKAGIIKKNCFIVSARQVPEAEAVIRRTAQRQKARFFNAEVFKGPVGLQGDFQKVNVGLAIQAARILRLMFGLNIAPAKYKPAIARRDWMGRMERFLWSGREFILDGAHNPLSVKTLVRSLDLGPSQPRGLTSGVNPRGCLGWWVVFGAMQDKNSKAMLEELSRSFSNVILTRVGNNRATSLKTLLEEAKGLFKCVLPAQNTRNALDLAVRVSGSGSKVLVTGSFYLVGEARKILKSGPRATCIGPRKNKEALDQACPVSRSPWPEKK